MFGSGQRDLDEDEESHALPIAGHRSFGGAKRPSTRVRIIVITAAVCFLVVLPRFLFAANIPLATTAPAMSPSRRSGTNTNPT
jgi:hypothetical protein